MLNSYERVLYEGLAERIPAVYRWFECAAQADDMETAWRHWQELMIISDRFAELKARIDS